MTDNLVKEINSAIALGDRIIPIVSCIVTWVDEPNIEVTARIIAVTIGYEKATRRYTELDVRCITNLCRERSFIFRAKDQIPFKYVAVPDKHPTFENWPRL